VGNVGQLPNLTTNPIDRLRQRSQADFVPKAIDQAQFTILTQRDAFDWGGDLVASGAPARAFLRQLICAAEKTSDGIDIEPLPP
jgi:hypothetical protein